MRTLRARLKLLLPLLLLLNLSLFYRPHLSALVTVRLAHWSYSHPSYLSIPPTVFLVPNGLDILWELTTKPGGLPPDGFVEWTTVTSTGGRLNGVQQVRGRAQVLRDPKKKKKELIIYRAHLRTPVAESVEYWISNGIRPITKKYYLSHPNSASNSPDRELLILGDNQYAATTFSRILRLISSTHVHPLPSSGIPTLPTLDAIIHLGDRVNTAASIKEWHTDFYALISSYGLNQIPWLTLRGNHDYPLDIPFSSALIRNTYAPQPSFSAHLLGSAYLITLDTTHRSPEQDSFLLAALTSPEARAASFRIVFTHIPPFVQYWSGPWSAESSWGAFLRTDYVPLFELHGVDLVISGHQHNYQRGERNGITYLIAGLGGGALDEKKHRVEEWGGMYEEQHGGVTVFEHGHVTLQIGQESVLGRMKDLEGGVRDQFVLGYKGVGGGGGGGEF